MKKNYLNEISAVFIVLLPLLSLYKSPLAFLDLGSLLMLVLFPVLYCVTRKRTSYKMPADLRLWTVYLVYMAAVTVLSYVFAEAYTSAIFYTMRMTKNIIYIVFTLYVARKQVFNVQLAKRLYHAVTWIATAYIFVQYALFRLFHYGLAGYIPALIQAESYQSRIETIATGVYFRPTSLFYEPSHYAAYVLMGMILYLFYSDNTGRNVIRAAVITLGIFVSTSGQGIVLALMIWGLWLLKQFKYKSRHMQAVKVLMLLFVFALVYYMVFTPSGIEIIGRWLPKPGQVSAVETRSEGFRALTQMPAASWILGNGYGNIPGGYFSSWAFNFWCFGIIGTSVIVLIYLECWLKSAQKCIVLINAVLCIFSTAFMGIYFVFFFSFILSDMRMKPELFYAENDNCHYVMKEK